MKEMEILKKALNESKYTVVLGSSGLMEESGRPSMRKQSRAYEIEKKYGYSPEDIFSAAFFSTRPEVFFDFYRAEVLPGELKPGKSFEYLKELEERNLIQLIITNNACNFYNRVGCKNVLPLHGDVEDNVCIGCGKKFSAEYIANSKGIPACDVCGKLILPKVVMFGEMVDNRKMTRAINEISKAELLIVIGTDLSSPIAERYVRYFDGRKLVVITPEGSYKDKVADLAIHQPIEQVLKELVESCTAR